MSEKERSAVVGPLVGYLATVVALVILLVA